jgi:serine/threonine-protein kinase
VLSHPNIVNVFDYGEDSGILYLIMEYLEGKSLEKLVEEQGMLPIQTIIPMYDQVCSALDHAHQHSVVHRDIKPANIMILHNGLVKVTDFGIAKMMSMGMTQAGQVLGTPNYMSPEQVKGRQVDGRSDIFSLGIILYDLVTGEMPFGGQNITTVIYKIINENPIPPRELDATIHPGLSYVICKALAKSPDERYQTCRELADDLKNFKYLAGPASPSATIMVKVPPLPSTDLERAAPPVATTEAVQTTPIEQPSPGQVPVEVMPPPITYQEPHTSPVVWILLTLGGVVLLGILGGGGYQLYKKSRVATPPQVGQLLVTANVSGATISVDGQSGPNWVTPYTISDLSVGSHQVVVSKEGYDDYPQSVTIEGGKPFTVNASLPARAEPPPQTPGEERAAVKVNSAKKEVEAPSAIPVPGGGGRGPGAASKTGQLLVTADLSGAKISVDGSSEPNWITPYSSTIGLAAGTHQVVVSKEGYDDYQQSVTIEGGKTRSLNAHLSVGSGEVEVVTKPPGLEVFIDGKSRGLSPVRAAVDAGSHSLSVTRSGWKPYEGTVTVTSGQVKLVTVTMSVGSEAATGVVNVKTIPPDATVTADGNRIPSQTPASFSLPAGRHTLVISLSGYRPQQRVIEVKAGEPVEVDVAMPR